jgi:hypothetical protein
MILLQIHILSNAALPDHRRRLHVIDYMESAAVYDIYAEGRGKIHSFIQQWLYSPLLGPGLFFNFVIFFTQTAGLLGRGITPSQGR